MNGEKKKKKKKTSTGREALATTIDLVHQLPEHNLNVVYGDTDSVMVDCGIPNTAPVQQAIDKANVVKRAVNSKYNSLEIDIDGIYKSILLVRKKKYAAMTMDPSGQSHREVKGLDLVRRDWCSYTSDAQTVILDFILSGEEEEVVRENILKYLEDLAAEVRSPEARLERFIITKSLTKDPSGYVDGTSQPHVVVAQRLQQNKIPVKVGDFIQYIICTGSHSEKLSARAFTPEEIIHHNKTIDKEWYLMQQFHPPISRLCEHIAGLDSHILQHSLGLEVTEPTNAIEATDKETSEYLITAPSLYRNLSERFYPLAIPLNACKKCGVVPETGLDTHHIIKERLLNWNDKCIAGSGLFVCLKCGEHIDLKQVSQTVVSEIRRRQREYAACPVGYECDYIPDDQDYITDRHIRDYVDFVKALFNMPEWFRVVLQLIQSVPIEKITTITGRGSSYSPDFLQKEVLEKVYALLSDDELNQVHSVIEYVEPLAKQYARSSINIGSLFANVTRYTL